MWVESVLLSENNFPTFQEQKYSFSVKQPNLIQGICVKLNYMKQHINYISLYNNEFNVKDSDFHDKQ